MMGITGAFSSLGINEPQDNLSIKKNPKNCSLPNLVLSERPNFTQIVCDDEIENTEQPVDFSKKYCETKVMKNDCSYNKVVKNYNSSFSMYAETDLDQPTDYSLRYAEDDSDSDRCAKLPKSEPTEFVQDTIKTYCTEDTPYETPFNFSTSTSMSDLRIDDKAITKDTETKENGDTLKEITHRTKVKSEFSSGLMSPEKPVNYCEEGTPGYFSRVASCGSLNCLSVSDQNKPELKEDGKKELRRVGKFPNETKAVKFEEVVNYAQETPLMFSRSSSLASLDSIEQHSIHDDRSSVVSDLSRLTSGIISPSELPDSPSQTVPPSPKPRKTPIVFSPVILKKTEETPHTAQDVPKSSVFEDVVKKFKMESTPLQFSTATSLSSLLDDEIDGKVKTDPIIKNENLSENSEDEDILAACINIGMQKNRYSQEKSDITGDSVRTYCTEDTPAVLSHAGSNSNLVAGGDKEEAKDEENGNEQAPPDGDKHSDKESRPSSLSGLSDDSSESDNEDLLQKCILAGMSSKTDPKVNQSSDDDDDILASCINMGMKNNRYTRDVVNTDTVKNYCTEDTPAALSHEGSCSNLSALSAQETDNDSLVSEFSDEEDERLLAECIKSGMAAISGKLQDKKLDLSDDSSEDDEALLQQCIQSGMPKKSIQTESNELTPAEKALLQQCILDGMKKCQIGPRPKPADEETSELTDAEESLLRQCILSGMSKNKLSQGRASNSRESTDLTEAERLLLQQCILAGMPKSKGKREVKRAALRRGTLPVERNSSEHTCCIHCPRNNANRFRQNGHVKSKRRYREREVVQIREGRDVNIVYVASQILTLKKEVSGRSHEKWV